MVFSFKFCWNSKSDQSHLPRLMRIRGEKQLFRLIIHTKGLYQPHDWIVPTLELNVLQNLQLGGKTNAESSKDPWLAIKDPLVEVPPPKNPIGLYGAKTKNFLLQSLICCSLWFLLFFCSPHPTLLIYCGTITHWNNSSSSHSYSSLQLRTTTSAGTLDQ